MIESDRSIAITVLLLAGLALAESSLLAATPKALSADTGTATQVGGAPVQPRLLGAPHIVVDRGLGRGTAVLVLRNDSEKPIEVVLSAEPPEVTGGARPADWTVSFAQEGTASGEESELRLAMAPGTISRVQAVVSNAWTPGEFQVNLDNHGVSVGKLAVSISPINVAVDTVAPANSSFELVDGTPARMFLKNEDPTRYHFFYEFLVAGHVAASGIFTIGPSTSALVEFTPAAPAHSLARIQDLLKGADARDDGALLLFLQSPAASVPARTGALVKILPVKASLHSLPPDRRAALAYLILVAVLTLGGITSLILSNLLPNRLQALNIKEQLVRLARTTANLSSHVGSRLGVIVRVERSRLYDLLTSRATLSPDFAGIVNQCKQGLASLSLRVDMLQQMDLVMQQLESQTVHGAPPSQVREAEDSLDKAAILLGKDQPTTFELQAAQAAITEASNTVGGIGRSNPAFGEELANRVRDQVSEIRSRLANKATYTRLSQLVPGPSSILLAVPAGAAIPPALYVSIDMALAKVELLRDYVLLAEGAQDKTIEAELTAQEPRLVAALQRDTLEALRCARLVLREMNGGVYSASLQAALEASPQHVSIATEPVVAYEGQPLTLRVRFHSSALDTAAAREEWACEWDFGDGLTERGWSASHYFLLPRASLRKQPKTFPISVRFQDSSGKVVGTEVGATLQVTRGLTVQPSRLGRFLGERTITESIRLAAALLIAMFGLVAGAKDQILKLDVLPGLVAVFLVGFGADTVKNLLSPK